jgi:hypothetical protein
LAQPHAQESRRPDGDMRHHDFEDHSNLFIGGELPEGLDARPVHPIYPQPYRNRDDDQHGIRHAE